MKDGEFGAATFMHPNALQVDSEGNLITACHHPHVVIKVRSACTHRQDARRTAFAACSPAPEAGLDLAVGGPLGAFGAKDQFAVAYWMQGSYRLYDKDGTPAGYYVGPDKAPRAASWKPAPCPTAS
jgi:hypothetical protein